MFLKSFVKKSNNIVSKKGKYAVEFIKVCKRFDGSSFDIIHNMCFKIETGKITALLGSSGAGKTTTARIINGLEKYQEGQVIVNGVLLNDKTRKQISRKTAFVFQNFNLFPNMSVLDNIVYAPIYVYKQNKKYIEKKAHDLLKKFNIYNKMNCYPHELSGGQKQRVAIIRALILDPEILIMDEPTASLDPELTHDVIDMIKDINSSGLTIIIITHDIIVAKKATDSILFLSGGKCKDKMKTADFFDKNVKKSPQATRFLENCF